MKADRERFAERFVDGYVDACAPVRNELIELLASAIRTRQREAMVHLNRWWYSNWQTSKELPPNIDALLDEEERRGE